ncbi:hypothetical protein QQZ08_006298 [Neonectria magnoliae]|uniref:RING-type domain-containing protein n=1 Tax=Neonectria magnoliae TaxID=2732573 RepID=A0ABR1I0W8_9HYPO
MAHWTNEVQAQTLPGAYIPTFQWREDKGGVHAEEIASQEDDDTQGLSPPEECPWVEFAPGQSVSGGPRPGPSPSIEAPPGGCALKESGESPLRESFWPNLRRYILGDADTKRPLKAWCPICREDFSVAGLPEPQANDAEPSNKVGKITPCGHIFCRECLKEAMKAQTADAARTCPVCRLQLSCRQCGTLARMVTAPRAPSASAVPLTMAEGARFQPRCLRCVSRRRWMERLLRGRWPGDAAQIEPGFVLFLFTTLDALEDARRERTVDAVMAAFQTVLEDEFEELNRERERFIAKEMRRARAAQDGNHWF